MSFNQLHTDLTKGIKRPIRSRKHVISITPEEFNYFHEIYFKDFNVHQDFEFAVKKKDKEKIVFMLRYYYNLWIEIDEFSIKIANNFPTIFLVTAPINKSNHPHCPEEFKKGTLLYLSNSRYATCNWLEGVPLWKDKDKVKGTDLIPSCQINYAYITPKI